jgi:hypothetical protein
MATSNITVIRTVNEKEFPSRMHTTEAEHEKQSALEFP